MLGQWYTAMKESRAALKAWNKGRPILSLETSQYASEHHAQYWARWAKELVMEQQLQYSPASRSLAAVVHKDFWVAVLRAHGLPNKDPQYWYPLVALSCMEGNLSVLDAFAQVFDAGIVSQWIENFSFVHQHVHVAFVHPRVVGWQLGHGHRAGKDIHRALALKWEQTSFARDAITGSQGAAVFLDWVRACLALPDDTASAQNAVGLLACIGKDLWEAKAEPGVRGEGGMPTLRSGHQYRKHRRGFDGSHMAAPLIAGDALRVMHAAYRRFGFEPILMDALVARWSEEDLQDPRVCALLYVRYSDLPSPRPPMTDAQWATICHNAQAEPLMVQALAWGDLSNPFSLYTTALPFFRETQAREELAQSLDLGDVFNEPVF